MQRYLAAFNVDDFETIGISWHTPGWLSTSESMTPLKDREEVKGLYRSLLGKIRAEGYDHSELLSEDLKFVNDSCVIYRITFTLEKRWRLHAATRAGQCLYATQGGREVGTR